MRTLLIEFTHLGAPPKGTQQGKRAMRFGNRAMLVPGPKTESAFEEWAVILRPHCPLIPLNIPLELELILVWPFPSGTTKKAAALGEQPKITKPDRVNVEKICEDCMKRVGYFTDDNLVWSGVCKKLVGPNPRTEVRIWGEV